MLCVVSVLANMSEGTFTRDVFLRYGSKGKVIVRYRAERLMKNEYIEVRRQLSSTAN